MVAAGGVFSVDVIGVGEMTLPGANGGDHSNLASTKINQSKSHTCYR